MCKENEKEKRKHAAFSSPLHVGPDKLETAPNIAFKDLDLKTSESESRRGKSLLSGS